MLTTIANIHRHKLPALGAIGNLKGLGDNRKYIVDSFPLSDSPDQHYSRGIHTVNVRCLANGTVRKVSGHWFNED